MSALGNIVAKEIRELVRDPRLMISMLVVPLVMFPLLGMAMSTSQEAAVSEVKRSTTAFVSFDNSDGNESFSVALKLFLEKSNITCRQINASSREEAVVRAVNSGAAALVIVPADFTERLMALNSTRIELYGVLKTYSMSEPIVYEQVSSAISSFSTAVVAQRLQAAYPNETVLGLALPVQPEGHSIIRGDVQDASPTLVVNSMMTSTLMMPMMLMILIIMAGQLAATSIGMEKEQKTLEVLLTLPMKRIHILIGKLSGVIIASLLATISYIVGFSVYYGSLTSMSGQSSLNLADIGLSPQPAGLALMMVSLLLSLIAALSLAIMLGVFTKDVRSAQSMLGILFVPVMIPALVLMFAPITSLPLAAQAVMLAIPFSYPVIAAQSLYTQDYLIVSLGIIYQFVFTAVVLAVAAHVFSTEKILTARLDFSNKKKAPEN